VDGMVDRSRSRFDGARKRLNRFSKKAKDNGIAPSSLMSEVLTWQGR
jgi:hypothetical protein